MLVKIYNFVDFIRESNDYNLENVWECKKYDKSCIWICV